MQRPAARGAAVLAVAFTLAALLAAAGSCSRWAAPASTGQEKPQGKVLLIGLDGATWDLMTPMIQQGRLPNIARLRSEGAWGPLQSFLPMASPVIWSTIATGKRPEDHGIQGFVKSDDSGRQVSYTNADRKARAIWNILSERNAQVAVIGWFVSWPADVVRGAFISDRSEGPLAGGAYPPTLDEMMERAGRELSPEVVRQQIRFLGPPFDISKEPIEEARHYKRVEESLDHYFRVDRLRLRWTLELMERQPFNFTAVFFKGLDPACHLTWMYMEPELFRRSFVPPPQALQRFGPAIPGYYEFLDEAVGQLVRSAPAGANVVIVSDHGFGPTRGGADLARHVNPVLARLALLEAGPENRPDPARSLVIDPTPQGKEGLLKRRLVVNRHMLAQRAPDAAAQQRLVEEIAGTLRDLRTIEGEPLFTKVELTRGALEAGGGGVRYGIDVTISERFSGIRETENGRVIVGRYRVGSSEFPLTDLLGVRREHTGDHRLNGMILMHGPWIQPGAMVQGATMYDVAPTVLRLVGLPPAADMKGRVLEDALRKELLPPVGPPVRSYEREEPIERVKAPEQPGVEEELQERLRTLGYIR